ncbi:heparin-sulfate lyase HepC [Carboxylicivirga sp. M1479]|uniref:heparin-sulfate lyase HepC n=1 Tax=Carboxylicivirga sp. M1479 TaxID=2594476 RepID=UPI00163DDEFD|nr:heparin-sulfate lyase HepC [Carboxylicivirga sp. M1479]
MLKLKRLLFIFLVAVFPFIGEAQKAKDAFELLNLNYPGLEAVKKHVGNNDFKLAQEALLAYYRHRLVIQHPEVNRTDRESQKKPSASTFEKADKGMDHQFFVHKGYGYFDYGDTINWQYWPVKDNEVRWQLHRMYWWIPMGQVYWSTGDERYSAEWVWQMRDWIKDNPRGLSKENDRFAWRQLETARRVQDQTNLFNYFIDSPHFTDDFLIEFLINYHTHAERIREKYSDRGNHLLFEAQRIIYAGGFFPEFKQASVWRKEGIDILNTEIAKQVYPDGLQYELSLNYHVAAINIFLKAYYMAQLSNMADEFPASYAQAVESMIMATINTSFPDHSYPMFSDAKKESKKNMLKNYKAWTKVFPENDVIRYYATEGKEGHAPEYLSKALKYGGFYTFRNGWDKKSTAMILKASPPAFWHSQPDNGTFELWVNGRNFMPDAGCYVYGGDDEIMKMRNWYRQSKVHQTLTLNNEDLFVDAQLIDWMTSPELDKLVYENPSYEGLTHQRTVYFIDQSFFVIVDKAIGPASGQIDLHYQLVEGDAVVDVANKRAYTTFRDDNNLLIQCFANAPVTMLEEEGKVSYAYRRELKRPAFAFQQSKTDTSNTQYITVIYPFTGQKPPKVKAVFTSATDGSQQVEVIVNKQKHLLEN